MMLMNSDQKIKFKAFFTEQTQPVLKEYYEYRKSLIKERLCYCSEDQLKGLQGQLRELEELLTFKDVLKQKDI